MTATVEPPRPAAAAPTPSALARAEGVELLGDVDGSGYEEGAALVRRADGQMVHLGPLMYALLESIDGHRTTSELAALISERLDRQCDEEHVVALAEKAAAQGLLAGTEQNAPPRRNPLLALRWRVLVTNPRVTKWLTMPFTFLFRPFVMWPVLACFAGVLWFVLIHKGLASATAQAFDRPGLLLLVFLLAVVSAAFHEIGHASACRYGGATPGGMGMGLYLVWPAFYTDVTDSYRLSQRDRLRVDLGGIYFNTIVAVVTMGVWLLVHVDALLLLIALQLLEMVKNLSPMIRSDGYHILSDVTGVPDLFSHLGPTLRRLLPGHHEPSALKGRARLIVTLWVLVIVPVLLSLMLGAVLLLPRMLTTAWESGHAIVANLPHEVGHAQVLAIIASLFRLVALTLPVVGSVLIAQRLVRGGVGKALSWSGGKPVRRVALIAVASAAAAGAAWAWVPSGQYQAVRASDNGTLGGFGQLLSAPQAAARPPSTPVSLVRLTPGTHLAVSMIPVGGATKAHPALFVIAGSKGQPAVAIVSDTTPDPADTTTASATTPTSTTSTGSATTTSSDAPTSDPVQVTVFPFKLPKAPGPGGTQGVAVGTTDGGIKYDVAYSLVTVSKGADVTNSNGAYAFANCKACTTVAVSFQIVLIVGRSANIAPMNAAGALNVNCPACMTTAIADQIVVTLTAQPSDALVAKLQDALQQLNALPQLGAGGTPAAVAAAVTQVQQQIDTALNDSGLVANPPAATTTTATTTSTTPSTTPTTTAAATTAPAVTTTTPSDTTPASTTPTTTQSSTTTTGTTTDTTTTTDTSTTATTTTTG